MKSKILIISNFASITLVVILFVQLQKGSFDTSNPRVSQVIRDLSLEESILENQYSDTNHIDSINDRLANLELKLDYLVTNLHMQKPNSEGRENNSEFIDNNLSSRNESDFDIEKYVVAETITNDILASGVLSPQRSMDLSIAIQDLAGSPQGFELTKKINAAINNDELMVETDVFP